MLTTLGLVELREQVWRQGRGKTWRALSRALRVSPRGESPRLARALVDFGADHAFAPAAAKVQEHYGVEVPVSRVSRVCYRTAAKIAAPNAGGGLPAQGPDWIVAQTDGTMIPMVTTSGAPPGADRRKHRKICWQEMRLAAARPLGSATTTYACSRGDVVAAGTAWAQAVNDRVNPMGGQPDGVRSLHIMVNPMGSGRYISILRSTRWGQAITRRQGNHKTSGLDS